MGKIVEVNDLTKTFYTKDGEIRVLDHINFHVEEGEIFSLLGPSGSGKSTILNILTKLLEPTEGTVTMGGTIGYMFQRDNLLDWRTIMDNITIGLEILKMKDKASLDRIERLLFPPKPSFPGLKGSSAAASPRPALISSPAPLSVSLPRAGRNEERSGGGGREPF